MVSLILHFLAAFFGLGFCAAIDARALLRANRACTRVISESAFAMFAVLYAQCTRAIRLAREPNRLESQTNRENSKSVPRKRDSPLRAGRKERRSLRRRVVNVVVVIVVKRKSVIAAASVWIGSNARPVCAGIGATRTKGLDRGAAIDRTRIAVRQTLRQVPVVATAQTDCHICVTVVRVTARCRVRVSATPIARVPFIFIVISIALVVEILGLGIARAVQHTLAHTPPPREPASASTQHRRDQPRAERQRTHAPQRAKRRVNAPRDQRAVRRANVQAIDARTRTREFGGGECARAQAGTRTRPMVRMRFKSVVVKVRVRIEATRCGCSE